MKRNGIECGENRSESTKRTVNVRLKTTNDKEKLLFFWFTRTFKPISNISLQQFKWIVLIVCLCILPFSLSLSHTLSFSFSHTLSLWAYFKAIFSWEIVVVDFISNIPSLVRFLYRFLYFYTKLLALFFLFVQLVHTSWVCIRIPFSYSYILCTDRIGDFYPYHCKDTIRNCFMHLNWIFKSKHRPNTHADYIMLVFTKVMLKRGEKAAEKKDKNENEMGEPLKCKQRKIKSISVTDVKLY